KKRQPADDPEADAAFEPELDVADVSTESDNGNQSLLAQPAQPSSATDDDLAGARAQVAVGSKRKRLAKALAAVAAIFIMTYAVFRWIQPSAFLKAQPTTRREARSTTVARYIQPSHVRTYVMSPAQQLFTASSPGSNRRPIRSVNSGGGSGSGMVVLRLRFGGRP